MAEITTYRDWLRLQGGARGVSLDELAAGNASPRELAERSMLERKKKERRSTGIGSIAGGILGGILGGVGGSVLPGAGTTAGAIAGGAGGSAAGEALEQLLTRGKVEGGDVAREGALGAAGGVAGKLIGAGGKLLFRGVGKGATKLGEDLAMRGVRANSSQLTKFAGKHREDLSETLKRHGLEGADVEAVGSKLGQLQSAFDDIALNAKVPIAPGALRTKLDEKLKPLLASAGTDNQKLAKQIADEFDTLLEANKGKPLSLANLTNWRRDFDALAKNFASDPILGGKNRAMGTILREAAQEIADSANLKGPGGSSLKELGSELSKLYSLNKIATQQANLGRGTKPLSLLDTINAGTGGVAGAIADSAGGAGGIPGAIAGATIGAGASKVVNSPSVIRAASRAATSLGDKAGGLTFRGGQPVALGAGQVGVRGAASLLQGPQEDLSRLVPVDGSEALASTAGVPPIEDGLGVGQTAGGLGIDINALVQQALSNPDAATQKEQLALVGQLLEIQEAMAPTATGKEPTGTEQTKIDQASAGLQAIDQLEQMMSSDPSVRVRGAIPGSPGARSYEAAKRQVMDMVARIQTGAALTEGEQKFYEQQLPEAFDSPEDVQFKLQQLREYLRSVALGQAGAGTGL